MGPNSIEDLKLFLPGAEQALEDPDVTEIMINGPHQLWIERSGRLEPLDAAELNAQVLHRAAIQIARPLQLDPVSKPLIDARLDDGSRVAISTPPASPVTSITIRRFGDRHFSARDLVNQEALPADLLVQIETVLAARQNILISGGTGSGKTTMLNALIELLPTDERIFTIEDTLELRVTQPNHLRFEARSLEKDAVTIRDLVRHALRHRPDHLILGEVRGREAADLLQALNTGHGGSLTTIHANSAQSALARIASCAMQDGGGLPWEVICRSVVDALAMVLHMARRSGRRYVEDAILVEGYDSKLERWHFKPAVGSMTQRAANSR